MVTTFSWRQPRSWSLLLLCLLLTGCATRVIYYWLDSAIVWQLDDYFSLDRSQKKLLDQEGRGLMAWHRQHGAAHLCPGSRRPGQGGGQPHEPGPGDPASGQNPGEPDPYPGERHSRTVRLAKTLTDEQVARFMADRVTRQQERQHDFATQSKAEMIRGFREKMNERLVFWIGKVKLAQEPLITQWAEWQYEMMAPGSTFRRPGPRSWIG